MTETTIDPHAPILMGCGSGYTARMLGGSFWVQCECGWIGPATQTETQALWCHSRHVAALDGGE